MENYKFEATIIDEDSEKLIIRITSNDYEDFESEQGKSKWTGAIKKYEEKLQAEKEELQAEKEELEIKEAFDKMMGNPLEKLNDLTILSKEEKEDNTISLNEAKSNQND